MSLASAIEGAIDGKPGEFGIYARNLNTGATIDINADQVFPAESAAKSFILVYYSRLVASGRVNPIQRVVLNDEHRYIGTGVLRYLTSGLSLTLQDLVWLMIIVSDNSATAMLLQSIGHPDQLNAAMHDLGYPTAQLNDITFEEALEGAPFSLSSPRDLAEIYTQMDERARAVLFRQQHLIGLPRRLPHTAMAVDVGITMPVRVYNKTGNGAGTFIDSRLFETDASSWVAAAMASGQTDFASRPDDVAPAVFGEIGELLYNAWGGADRTAVNVDLRPHIARDIARARDRHTERRARTTLGPRIRTHVAAPRALRRWRDAAGLSWATRVPERPGSRARSAHALGSPWSSWMRSSISPGGWSCRRRSSDGGLGPASHRTLG